MRESGKASSVKVYCQWLVRDAERINSQIKLLSADQQRVVDVLLHDVGLNLLVLQGLSVLVFPGGNVLYVLEEKDSLPL